MFEHKQKEKKHRIGCDWFLEGKLHFHKNRPSYCVPYRYGSKIKPFASTESIGAGWILMYSYTFIDRKPIHRQRGEAVWIGVWWLIIWCQLNFENSWYLWLCCDTWQKISVYFINLFGNPIFLVASTIVGNLGPVTSNSLLEVWMLQPGMETLKTKSVHPIINLGHYLIVVLYTSLLILNNASNRYYSQLICLLTHSKNFSPFANIQ